MLVGGHRDSIMTFFLLAWITTPHPGWFAELVEAKKRNPKKSDIKDLFSIENFSDIFKNNLIKILLVASLANIGRIAGTLLAVSLIVQLTGIDPRDDSFCWFQKSWILITQDLLILPS